MEVRLCRFCLSSKHTDTNPLVSPCHCKGSMEFVHFKCLNRWRNVDIERNGRTCSLCMTNYRLPRLHEYEVVPVPNTWSLYMVYYPGLTLSFYHYVFIVCISSTRDPTTVHDMESLYKGTQYIFHGCYALLVANHWNVQNKRMYLNELKTIWPFLLLFIHGFLFSLFSQNPHFIGPLLSFYLGIYWKFHTRLLANINQTLLEMELIDH